MKNDASVSVAKVRIIVGAESAYACITHEGGTLDVALAPGKSAADALRERAAEWRADAARAARRAELADAAAAIV